jgi:hypothetical protein
MKFILTPELGRLCRWLRVLGYDSYYFKGSGSSLIINALKEDRLIVTRIKRLEEEKTIKKIIIESNNVEEQLKELKEKTGIEFKLDNLFSRCVECNSLIKEIDKETVKDKVPEYVFKTQETFYKCPKCKKIYWQGTHWELAKKFIEKLSK